MIEVDTPCRLHFGLLAYSRDRSRQYGGVGLMVRGPRVCVRVRPAGQWSATGPMHERALTFAQRFIARASAGGLLNAGDVDAFAASIEVAEAPRPHTGLGTGTQLGMAVARALAELIGRDDLGVHDLAALVGRGARSAIGAHGFFHGGLIIEGGKRDASMLSPMLVQQPFPPAWRLVLVTPTKLVGINGEREVQAFARMAPIPRQVTAEMCRLVLLDLLPSVIERDLPCFGRALGTLQQRVGECFSSAQGGVYADPLLERMVGHIRDQGIEGVGQSSWGPTLYAVTDGEAAARTLAADLCRRFELAEDEVAVTGADNEGCTVRRVTSSSMSGKRG